MAQSDNDITLLLNAWISRTLTPEQEQELMQIFHQPFLSDEIVLTALKQIWDRQAITHTAETESAKRMVDRIIAGSPAEPEINIIPEDRPESVPMRTVHRVHFIKRWGWAAAVIMILGTAVYVWSPFRKADRTLAKSEKILPADVSPGGNKAFLTLSNGTTIILDSADNGVIADQGGAEIIKTADGQIAYEIKGEPTSEMSWNSMTTPRGGQYQLQLPDGTQVWLNAASRISYPTAFTGAQRKVSVAGEAYFDVAKNSAQPFIVDVDGKASVEVLGTRFNVNAYNDEPGINTTLLDGRIRMIGQAQTALMKPGQQAQIVGQQLKVVDNADVEVVTAWKSSSFKFNNTHLDQVLRQFSRWYDIDIVYQQKVPDILFKGAIKKDLNLSQALIVLETMGVHFVIEGKKLLVMP